MNSGQDRRDVFYGQAATEFGPALSRLAQAYESDPDQRRDLLQDIHFALWRSFAGFAGQCSLRTWVYRVAHNIGISGRLRRRKLPLVSLEELAETSSVDDPEHAAGQANNVSRLRALISQLKPVDRQVILLYLEDLDAAAIGEISGLSPRAVATRIHRIKALLTRHFGSGEQP